METRWASRTLALVLVFITGLLSSCSKDSSSKGEKGKSAEPPAPRVVFRDAKGRELTETDLAGVTGQVRWEIVGGDNIPLNAQDLHRQGREAGGKGDHEKALACFTQARLEAPNWPYPVYDAAFTHLLKGEAAKAEELYAAVDRMAPRGFFTAKTALDCLRREKKGELKPGSYKAYVLLEWENDPVRKRTLLEQLIKQSPKFPAAWKDLALLQEDASVKLELIENGLSHAPDGEVKGILLINKALTLNEQGNRDEATRILGELALDPESTLGTEHLAKVALASFVTK
jgi:tetratricopeptide (TPR) repeat protein